jgi:uncharacterized membrane protein YhaH (DUF805 family)
MDDHSTGDEYLLSFEGRFNRARCWYALYVGMISCLVRLIFLVFLAFVLDVVFGTSVKSVHLNIYDIFNDPPAFPFRVSFGGSGPAWLVSILFYVFAASSMVFAIRFPAATMVKRLHDRNKSGWWMVPFVIVPILLPKAGDWFGDSTLAELLMLAMAALGLWGLVEMLGLKGTSGPNRFGPDPLQATAKRTPHAAPDWDQLRELEFVRRGAGPAAGEHVKRGHD